MTVGQDDFAAAVLAPDQPVPSGLSNPDGRPATKRFDIYRNNVVISLTEALGVAFPVVAKLLGGEMFDRLAGTFVRAHPPSSPVLMLYGAALPAFLEHFAPLKHIGYLPDVARLEQAIREAYHAADADAVPPDALAALPPEALTAARITLAPAVRLVRSPWPVHAIWQFNMVDGAPKPAMEAQGVLVVRPAFDPEPVLLGPGAAAFLLAVQDGLTIGDAFERATASAPDFDFAHLLGQLMTGQAITRLET
ncbi:MAG: DNA-binding domain-containing protein [Pseudomonadota bacterium]